MRIRQSGTKHVWLPPSATGQRRGFVLLLVLALLTFATVILVRFAQQSLNLTAQAQRREREIQHRWGTWSLANAGLARANRILRAAETDRETRQSVRSGIKLGGYVFHVCVHDLDAGLNLNTLQREAGLTAVHRAVRYATRRLSVPVVQIRLPSTAGRVKTVYDSWGQIFDTGSTAGASVELSVIDHLHRHITCWGSGRLNLTRTPDENLRHFGSAIGRSGLFGRIIRERKKSSDVTIEDVISEAATTPADRQLLERTLRSDSGGYSVFVTSETGGPALLCILEIGSGNFADRRSVFSF